MCAQVASVFFVFFALRGSAQSCAFARVLSSPHLSEAPANFDQSQVANCNLFAPKSFHKIPQVNMICRLLGYGNNIQ